MGRREIVLWSVLVVLIATALALSVALVVLTFSGRGGIRNDALAHSIYESGDYSLKTAVQCYDNAGTRDGRTYNHICSVWGGTNATLYVSLSGQEWTIVSRREGVGGPPR